MKYRYLNTSDHISDHIPHTQIRSDSDTLNHLQIPHRDAKFGIQIVSDWRQKGQIWDFLRSVSVHFGSPVPFGPIRPYLDAKFDNPVSDSQPPPGSQTITIVFLGQM